MKCQTGWSTISWNQDFQEKYQQAQICQWYHISGRKQRGSLVPLSFPLLDWYHLHIWGCWYFSWQSGFQLLSHPALHFTSAYKLNKQGDITQCWHTSFPILNQSFVPCLVLTVVSWAAFRFLRRQVRWSGIPISWRIFHSFLWSTESKALA